MRPLTQGSQRDINFELEEGNSIPSRRIWFRKSTILNIICGFTGCDDRRYFTGRCPHQWHPNQQSETSIRSSNPMPYFHIWMCLKMLLFHFVLRKIDKKRNRATRSGSSQDGSVGRLRKRSIRKLSGGTTSACSHCPCHHQPTPCGLVGRAFISAGLEIANRHAVRTAWTATTIGHYLCLCHSRSGRSPCHGDWIFVMNDGEIVQSGTPVDIYDEPINHFVATFIGESNILPGTHDWGLLGWV